MKQTPEPDWPYLLSLVRNNVLAARALLLSFLVVALSAVGADIAFAQSASAPGVNVSLAVDKSELTVGDVVTLSIVVSHPQDLFVVIPRFEREWGQFEVQDQTTVQTVSVEGGIKTVAKQLRVTLFAPGAFETPDLPVSVVHPDGTEENVYPTPLLFTVNSVLTGPDEELKDIRPLAELSTPFWRQPYFIILIAVSVVLAITLSSYLLYRRSRRGAVTRDALTDRRDPREIALQELDRIKQLDLPGRGRIKEHYTLVAETLRTYLGRTCLSTEAPKEARDLSTAEFGKAIGQSSLDQESSRLALGLLQEADLVKFANYAPLPPRSYEAAGEVRSLVEGTWPSFSAESASFLSPEPGRQA